MHICNYLKKEKKPTYLFKARHEEMYVWNEKVLIMIYGARAVEQRESAWVWQSAQDNDRLQRGSL